MPYIDTHAHLDFKDFETDLDQVIQRASEAGVEKIITVGYNAEGNRKAVALAEKYGNIWATVGIHPYDVKFLEPGSSYPEEMRSLIEGSKKVVAIGECGLDYHYDDIDIQKQKNCFLNQIKLAKNIDLPLIIHCRDAEEDTLEILSKEKPDRVVMHCFPGGAEFAKKCLDLGCYLSFTGVVTYKNAEKVREAVNICPMDKLMIETDCPFLAPQSHRGDRNEPAYVVEIAGKIAEVKSRGIEEVANKSSKNAETFFCTKYKL